MNDEHAPDSTSAVALWVGCYTDDMQGSGEGISALRRTDDGFAPLGAPTPVSSPSFLALHPSEPVLYAVSEGEQRVHAFRFDDAGALSPLGGSGATGELVCHVAVDPDGAFLVVSCWGDGAVLLFELEADGTIAASHTAPASEDPYGEDRQSRAHSCLMFGGGRMVTTDMGHDQLRCWSFTPEQGLAAEGTLTLAHGCGPRHFARSSAGSVYVDTEYSGEVIVLTESAGSDGTWLASRGSFPVSASGVREGDAAAEICLDAAEQNLYVGVRGSDVICRLRLDAEGLPAPAEEIPLPGTWPRHHVVVGDQLVVALQLADLVASMTLDAGAHSSRLPQLLATGSPTCLLPHRSS